MLPKFRGRSVRRRRGPLPFRYVLLLTLVIFIILTAVSFWIVNVQVEATLMRIAKFEANKVATTIIHNAVEKEVLTEAEQENLVDITTNSNGNVTSVNLNQRAVHAAKKRVQYNITEKLSQIERNNFHSKTSNTELADGIVYGIPLGVITNNSLLSSLGPEIPIQYYLIGDVFVDTKSETKEYGINGGVHEISLYVEVSVQVVIPFATEVIKATNTIPIVNFSERGDVPQYHGGGSEGNLPDVDIPGLEE
ncbi:sporulation protein YunB [Bacillus sp. 7586-K]|nr:sporulation protein YunB [Bacillus sp. 7586-K]